MGVFIGGLRGLARREGGNQVSLRTTCSEQTLPPVHKKGFTDCKGGDEDSRILEVKPPYATLFGKASKPGGWLVGEVKKCCTR